MKNIEAIGFDLFNTLITVEPVALEKAMEGLVDSLQESGIEVEEPSFSDAHQQSAAEHIAESRSSGKETHNSFWISGALEALGHRIDPGDALIAKAVEDYFAPFVGACVAIPGTHEALGTLQSRYRLGLLSNFTHGSAALGIIRRLGLEAFFEVILISGDLGYRKPFSVVFDELLKQLGVEGTNALYVGDDTHADVKGAQDSGIQPVWTTYVQDHGMSAAPSLLARSAEEPDSSVPRISEWDDLLALLDAS